MLRLVGIGLATALAVAIGLALIGFAAAPQLFEPPPNLYRGTDFRFELPRGWKCVLDGTEWVCQLKEEGNARRAAIIVFARKIRNPKFDSLEHYEAYLRTPQKLRTLDGKKTESKVIHVRRVQQASHTWIDAKHFESEIPNYFTRYLATTTSHYGVLVTYSVHRDRAELLETQLDRAFRSLKINQRY